MLRYSVRRILAIVPISLAASLLIFALVRLAPADPVDIMFSPAEGVSLNQISPEAKGRRRAELGLLDPAPVQYIKWLGRIARLDLGTSFGTRAPIVDDMARRLPVTASLGLTAFGVMLVVAVPLGIFGAVRQGRASDHGIRLVLLVIAAMPSFWTGLLLLYLFGVKWHVISIAGGSGFKQLILPAIVLGGVIAPTVARFLRASMISQLGRLYVVFAQAQGLSERKVLWRHAVRVAILPVVTLFGLSFAGLLTGSVIVESVFSIPGLGKWVVDAISARDYPAIQAYMLFAVAVVVLANLLVDLSYAWLDPRIRLGESPRG